MSKKQQKLMLTWMTSYPALIGKLEKYITPEDFTTPLYRQIAEMIVLQYQRGRGESGKAFESVC